MTRRISHFVSSAAFLCVATAACAQHGGGPGGPGGPPPGAGGPGGNNPGNNHDHGYVVRTVPGGPGMPALNGAHPMPLPAHGIHSMGLAGRWWDDSRTAKSLGLSADQRKQMDQIFESGRPAIAERFTTLLTEQKTMNEMPNKDLNDESKVNAAVDRVTEARAALERTTSGVLQQIRGKLTEGQQAKLDDEIAKEK